MLLATAGKDHKVRIYDETTKSLAFEMHDLADLPGHSNRVFCVKFNKQNPNLVVSGGWDNTIQFYDLRYRGPIRTLYGPHICGDCIDFTNDGSTMVTGSYRVDDCIEAWDLRMYKRSRVIPWEGLGSQEVLLYDEDESDPQTDLEEAKSNRTDSALSRADSTTTTTKKVRK